MGMSKDPKRYEFADVYFDPGRGTIAGNHVGVRPVGSHIVLFARLNVVGLGGRIELY